MKPPIFSLDAVIHRDLYKATPYISIHDMEYYLWVRVDPEIARGYSLYGLDEVDSEKKYDLNLEDFCSHEPNRPWYKFNSMLLNRDPGKHVYRMHFVNTLDDNTTSLYFSYHVQREDTEKPYVYMENLKNKDAVKI